MHSNTWSRSGSGGECVSKHYATMLQDEDDATATKSAKKGHTPEATTLNGESKASRKDPPARNQNPVVGKKRKSPNNKTTPNPKRTKETSNSEVRPFYIGRHSGHRCCSRQRQTTRVASPSEDQYMHIEEWQQNQPRCLTQWWLSIKFWRGKRGAQRFW